MSRGRRGSSAVIFLVVLVVLVIAVVLLQRTASTAEAIDKKAVAISKSGRGINDNTDAILQLSKTNQLGSSILGSATPLQGQLSQVVDLANSINGLAGSINAFRRVHRRDRQDDQHIGRRHQCNCRRHQ